MFDTVCVMKKILLSQMENTSTSCLKMQVLNGVPLAHVQGQQSELRLDSMFRNIGMNQHMNDGGAEIMARLFNDFNDAQAVS